MNIKKNFRVILPVGVLALAAVAWAGSPQILQPAGPGPSTASFTAINKVFTGDWQQYGQLFTSWQGGLFNRIFLLILTIVPVVFLLHYIIIGAKSFSHAGTPIKFFGILTRFLHWLAALSFSLLVITGLMVVFGKFIGGGPLVMSGRSVHLIAAIVFCLSAAGLFLIWLKDMLPMPHDILWLLIMGGYLSKKKKPVPAGKFNAGQKVWFWLATVGGGIMAWSGYTLYSFAAPVDQIRQMAILHNLLAAGLVAFFIIHLYMSLFAVKGAISSMLTGYKSREEVAIMHSRYKI